MANHPSISIIIPAYNVEDYLLEALDSIKSQTKYPDEVILIDDGSIDNTLSIAKSYDFSFPYKVLSVDNGGQGRARNIGTELAKSDYIYYFDSDDLLHEDFIKEIKHEIQLYMYPDIILFSGKSFYDKDFREHKRTNYSRGFNDYFEDRALFLKCSQKHKSLFCQPCCYISKRDIWVNTGLKFPDNYLEDDAIFFPLLFKCETYRVIDSVYFYRRIRNNSTMTIKPTSKHVIGAINCINSIIDLLENNNNNLIETQILKKRLASYCLAYISLARKANIKLSIKLLSLVALKSKSISFVPKAVSVAIRVHELRLISYVNQILKRR